MNATAVGALSSPAAIGARLVDARLASRRVRVVARRRGRNSSSAPRRFDVIADATSNDDDADQATGAAAVLAGVAAAAAIAVAGPARGADFEFMESARAAGVSAPDGSATIVLQAPQSFMSNAPREDRPVVDADAHTRYLDALDARGIEPGKITYVGGVPQHPKGLSRFGSAATAADETASLVSTGFAILIFAALGAAGNRDGSGSGGVRKSNPKPSKPSRPFTVAKTKTNTAKTTRGVDGGRRLFSGGAANRPSGGFGGGGGFRGGPRAPAPAPAPAAQAAVALATTVVVGSLAAVGGGGGGVGGGGVGGVGGGAVGGVGGPSAPAMTATATATAETELAVAAAAGAAVLGATVVGTQRFNGTVKSNIVAYDKPATAPTPKAKTTVVSKPKPPRKPPSKPSTADRDAASSNTSSETLGAIAAFGVGVFILASVSSAPPSAPPREAFEVERKRPAEKPFATTTTTTTTTTTRRGSKLDGDAVMPLVAVVLLIAAGATVAGVGLEDEETTETEKKTLETLRATDRSRSDAAGAARRAAEAQRWIDDWKRERASSAAAPSSSSISSSSTSTLSSSAPGPKTSYYEVIDGVKYDRKVLDACRRSEADDGFISLDEAKAILTDVVDGPTRPVVRADGRTLASSVTNVEIDTAAYALRTFRWTSAARKWFTRAMETIDAPDAEAIREDDVKTFTAKELTSTDATSKSKSKSKTKTTEANATDATRRSATRPARRGASAYETIDGVRYDRATLDACRAYTEEDGFISLAEAKSVYEGLVGGPVRKVTRRDGSVVKSSITNVELDTAQYIFLHFKWSEPAKKWFADKFVDLDRQ